MENFYLRHTWLEGDVGNKDIDINTTELAVSAKFPNFLHSPQPLIITPGFNLHLLSGPLSPPPPHVGDNLELPGQLYEAFGDLSWNPCYTPQLGAEINVRIGVFADFNTLTTDSVRILGTGLGVDGTNERVDINDIRLYVGLEWTTALGPTGLFEAGYVMDRELVYVNDPPFDQNLNDTFMLRAGLIF